MVDEQEDIETTKTNTIINEDDLELTLSYNPKNLLLEPSRTNAHPHQMLTKRDAQALRRQEAKLKRDLKRSKTHQVNNDVVFVANNNQRCLKVPNLGFHVGPLWFGWNGPCFNGAGLPTFQVQNYKFEGNGNGNGNDNNNDCGSFSSGSSSGFSDNHHSNSGAGANSSDAGSHSSHPHSQMHLPSVPSSSEVPPCSTQLDLQLNDSDPNHLKSKLCSSYSNQIGLVLSSTPSSKSPERPAPSTNTTCIQNGASPNSDKDPNTTPQSIFPKEGNGETGKPPRPNGLKGQQKPLSSEMPCVSTTGNGPNGRTISGILYKYSKAEVSIICVCHGSSFSPAEFVEHAGGVDVEYPLRHIRVVPFALG